MQQQKHSRQARQALTRGPALLILLGAAALLAMLMVAGWGSARAAPRSGGAIITILSITDNTLNLQFDGWTLNQTVTLSYSENVVCRPSQPLPNATFSITANPFNTTYTWPSSGIAPGTYYLCGTDPVDGTTASQQTITVNSNGTVQPTPGIPGATPTTTTTTSANTPTTTTGSPVASATTSSGTTGTPGNGGQGASPPPSNADSSTLVAIILLCLLVLALLAYLIRIWLQGRQPSASPPGGGGQQKP